MMLDGVDLVGGGVAAFARQLPLEFVGPRAARDVDVTPAQVATGLQGRRRRRRRRGAVDDDAGGKQLRVLRGAEARPL